MRISKRQSRLIALGTLAGFFGLCLLLVWSNRTSLPPPSPQKEPSNNNSTLTLQNFQRSEVRNGKKLWEVKASLGEFIPTEQKIKVTEVTLWVYRPDGEVITLKADRATLSLSGATLANALAEGHVDMDYNGKIRVLTEEANYDKTKNLVTAPGAVSIWSEMFTSTGDGLEAWVDTRVVKLLRNVTSRIVPTKGKRETS